MKNARGGASCRVFVGESSAENRVRQKQAPIAVAVRGKSQTPKAKLPKNIQTPRGSISLRGEPKFFWDLEVGWRSLRSVGVRDLGRRRAEARATGSNLQASRSDSERSEES